MSVDLPAPFSPSRAWISPAPQLEVHAVQRRDAAEALRHAAESQQRSDVVGGHVVMAWPG